MTATYQDIEIDTIDNPCRPHVLEGQGRSSEVPVSGTAGGCDQTPDAPASASRSEGTRRRDQTRPVGRPRSGKPEGDATALLDQLESETASPEECGLYVLLGGQTKVVRMPCDRKSCDACRFRIGDGHFAPVRAAFASGSDLYVAIVDDDAWDRLRDKREFRRSRYRRFRHGESATVIADRDFEGSSRIADSDDLEKLLNEAFERNVAAGVGNNISGSRVWARERGKKQADGPRAVILPGPPSKWRPVLEEWKAANEGPLTDERWADLVETLGGNPAKWLKQKKEEADRQRLEAAEREWEAMAIEYEERPF